MLKYSVCVFFSDTLNSQVDYRIDPIFDKSGIMEKGLYKRPSVKLIELLSVSVILNDSSNSTEQLDEEQFIW